MDLKIEGKGMYINEKNKIFNIIDGYGVWCSDAGILFK